MSDDERRAFKNLILLCKPHHDLIDTRYPERYSVDDLAQWKVDREGTSEEPLDALGAVSADDLEVALLHGAQIRISGSVVSLGGKGGSAPRSGGGGGGALGDGTGGSGGRGGDVINLDGLPGDAPGAGGGGGGALAPGAVGGEGGGGGQIVTTTIQVDEGDSLEFEVGEGGGPAEPGRPTVVYRVSSDGTHHFVARAEAGDPGRSGAAVLDAQLGPAVSIAAAMFADVVQVRDSLLFVLGGGWDQFSLDVLPGRLTAPFVVLAEAQPTQTRPTELLFELRDDRDIVRQEQRQVIAIPPASDPWRVPVAILIDVEVASPGLWHMVVISGSVQLANVALRITESARKGVLAE
jgi:hypothetical protein